MDITTARAYTRLFLRNAGDPTFYTDTQVDLGIQMACDEVIRRAKLLPRVDSVTLTSGSATLPAMPTGFRPDRLMEAYLSGSNVQINPGSLDPDFRYYTIGAPTFWNFNPTTAKLAVVDYVDYVNQNASQASSGQPVMMTFASWAVSGTSSTTSGSVYPTPNQNYTLNVRWLDYFTQWTPGTGSGLSTTLNLPDEWLKQILMYGPESMIAVSEPENQKVVAMCQQKFEETIQQFMGMGNLGTDVVVTTTRGGCW